MRELLAWLKAEKLPPAIEAVTTRVASRYKTETMVQAGRDVETANAMLSGLRTYWTWLVTNGHCAVNPWAGLSLKRKRKAADKRKRAFLDNEIVTLLNSGPDDILRDAMVIAALSGMRRGELAELRVADCQHGEFRIREGKTAAAERVIPVHSALAPVIERLAKGKRELRLSPDHHPQTAGRQG